MLRLWEVERKSYGVTWVWEKSKWVIIVNIYIYINNIIVYTLNYIMLYYNKVYYTILYHIISYHNMIWYYIILNYIISHKIILQYIISHQIMLHYIILYMSGLCPPHPCQRSRTALHWAEGTRWPWGQPASVHTPHFEGGDTICFLFGGGTFEGHKQKSFEGLQGKHLPGKVFSIRPPEQTPGLTFAQLSMRADNLWVVCAHPTPASAAGQRCTEQRGRAGPEGNQLLFTLYYIKL